LTFDTKHYAILDGMVEILVKVLKDSIKTTQFNIDKDQNDICTASSAGDEIQSAGVKRDELPTAIIAVKGMWSNNGH
jgi:hypothetical protein